MHVCVSACEGGKGASSLEGEVKERGTYGIHKYASVCA